MPSAGEHQSYLSRFQKTRHYGRRPVPLMSTRTFNLRQTVHDEAPRKERPRIDLLSARKPLRLEEF